ncbi:MAG: HNH endonuclease [Ignavibacteria bacterium]|jgi:hypothetical protein|nr:HNH endonuclease [Ignavibacteria bacterium]
MIKLSKKEQQEELDYIAKEINSESPSDRDLLEREMLFDMQILLRQDNFIDYFLVKTLFEKKVYKQTESGKKMFIHLYELSKKLGDKELTTFSAEVLKVFEKYNMNGHIEWKK